MTEDPLEYALKWAGEDAAERWVDYYDRASIGALTTGGLVLRKRAGDGDGWFASRGRGIGADGPASDQLERVFAAHDFRGDLRARAAAARAARARRAARSGRRAGTATPTS